MRWKVPEKYKNNDKIFIKTSLDIKVWEVFLGKEYLKFLLAKKTFTILINIKRTFYIYIEFH